MNVDTPAGARRFSTGDLPVEPWRNGGGLTRTLHQRRIDGRTAWRVSLADITRDGAFSAFPGLDRRSVLVAGRRVLLRGDQLAWSLDGIGSSAAYPGELALQAELHGGPARFFNAMVDRERAAMALEIGRGPRDVLPIDGDAVLYVLDGAVAAQLDRQAPVRLGPGQGLVLEGPHGELSIGGDDASAHWILTTFHTR